MDGNLLVAYTAAPGFFTAVGTVRKVDPQGRWLPYGPATARVRIAFPQDIAIVVPGPCGRRGRIG